MTDNQDFAAEGEREISDRVTRVVSNADKQMMYAIERFILAYEGDNLLHDISLNFPNASYLAFWLAYERSHDPVMWLEPEGTG